MFPPVASFFLKQLFDLLSLSLSLIPVLVVFVRVAQEKKLLQVIIEVEVVTLHKK